MQNNCSLVVIDTAGGTTSQCRTRQVAVIVKKEFVIATGAGLTRRLIYGITPANSFDNCLSVRTHTSCYVSEAATTRTLVQPMEWSLRCLCGFLGAIHFADSE